MATRRKYRERYLRWHKQYEKKTATEMNKVLTKWIKRIKWETLSAGAVGLQLDFAFEIQDLESAYFRTYRAIGEAHGKRIGKEINRNLKDFTLDVFIQALNRTLGDFMREFAGVRITSIKRSLIEDIVELINSRLERGLTIREAAKEVEKIVNRRDFRRWRALRIARTESTAASNYAAMLSANVSGFEMEKEWISANDSRTRRRPDDPFDHLRMDGKRVGVDELFIFNEGSLEEDKLLFPGDPRGRAGNVINCRCSIGFFPKRDSEGNLIPR